MLSYVNLTTRILQFLQDTGAVTYDATETEPQLGEIKKVRSSIRDGKKCCYRKYIWSACKDCGKERWVAVEKGEPVSQRCRPCVIRTDEHRKKVSESHQGDKSSSWKGGRRITRRGYIYIWLSPDDFFFPMANAGRCVLEHRLVVAKALGRCLHAWEIVHHKGAKYPKGSIEDKQDNRYPENLQLVSDDRHNQITILENRIRHLEERVTLLEAENVILRANNVSIH